MHKLLLVVWQKEFRSNMKKIKLIRCLFLISDGNFSTKT